MPIKQMRKQEGETISFFAILLSGFVGLFIMIGCTFLCSWLISRELLPTDNSKLFGLAIIFIGTFFASLIASKKRSKRLLHGMCAAFFSLLMLLIAGMLLFSGGLQMGRLLLSITCMLIGGIGGVFLGSALD